jgi:thiaminase
LLQRGKRAKGQVIIWVLLNPCSTQLHEYAQWRDEVAKAIEMYRDWCERYELKETHHSVALLSMLDALSLQAKVDIPFRQKTGH